MCDVAWCVLVCFVCLCVSCLRVLRVMYGAMVYDLYFVVVCRLCVAVNMFVWCVYDLLCAVVCFVVCAVL